MALVAGIVGLMVAGGCSSGPERVNGAAKPAGAVESTTAAPSPTPSVVTTSPSARAGLGESAEPSTSESSTPKASKSSGSGGGKLVLGPNGLGALKLGMSMSAALKTGLLVGDGEPTTQGCNTDYQPKAAGSARAPVFFNQGDGLGLVSFTAYPGVATPEGIKLGSSAAAVGRAYPSAKNMTGPEADGRWYAPVPGNSEARYNITLTGGKVTHFNLQLNRQGCYE
ncbi:hypothetical protein GCM10009828_038280 [Actinoplanes couchii]|uniref:Lipoprotein n=2 Tax=Actinoplanes couchii TaxID=403638 RepID=A0ABQ3XS55_9ACTN|nr:hypothetical protein Aco03nite_097480 [Actinoplanes couchii]